MNDSERQWLDMFLDGEPPDAERAHFLAQLEKDPQAVAYLAERALLQTELGHSLKRRKLQRWALASAATHEAHQHESKVVQMPRWTGWRPLSAAALAVAAALALVLWLSETFIGPPPRIPAAISSLPDQAAPPLFAWEAPTDFLLRSGSANDGPPQF